jgi:hypothetical protein
MIEEFFLPDRTMAVEEHVDPPGRGTLNRMHDLGQAEVPSVRIPQGTQQKMGMIRHDNRGM